MMSAKPQSATSLPIAPQAEAGSRLVKYMVMMGIRVVCFGAMVLITPYGWYTWLFGAGAVFLPYIAVVIANVSRSAEVSSATPPGPALTATPTPPPGAAADAPGVIRITEAASDMPRALGSREADPE